MTRRIFDFIDKNKDGLLDTEELLSFMTNMATYNIEKFQGVFSHMTKEERSANLFKIRKETVS